MHFFTSSQCFWMALTLQNLKLGGNLEFSWYSCNILRYCSNRCIVWIYIPENCPAHANRKFLVQLYIKIQILFEPPFWICKWANHLSFLAMTYYYVFKYIWRSLTWSMFSDWFQRVEMSSSLSSTCFKSSSMSLRSVSTVKFTSLRILVTSLLTRLSRTGWNWVNFLSRFSSRLMILAFTSPNMERISDDNLLIILGRIYFGGPRKSDIVIIIAHDP